MAVVAEDAVVAAVDQLSDAEGARSVCVCVCVFVCVCVCVTQTERDRGRERGIDEVIEVQEETGTIDGIKITEAKRSKKKMGGCQYFGE